MIALEQPTIRLATVNGTTYVELVDGDLEVAHFHKQGNYRLRCYISPDEFIDTQWATREAAESAALKHAGCFA